MNQPAHIPVLLDEFLSFFENSTLEFFVDGTLGAGGHAEAILKAHPEIKKFVGFDQDKSALKIASSRLEPFKEKVIFVEKNFCEMKEELKRQKIEKVDGIFLDIGVSSMQLDRSERGFSFSKEGPLDMRMDQECTQSAEEIVNEWSEKELGTIFKEYGDVSKWRIAAQKIVEERKKKRITTTTELVELLSPYLKMSSKKKLHPLTLVFQALRIAVNNELDVLKYTLPVAISALKPKGKLGVISFHSGEDRIVKNYFKEMSSKNAPTQYRVTLLNKKPIEATVSECKKNPRARSAKMRFVEKEEAL